MPPEVLDAWEAAGPDEPLDERKAHLRAELVAGLRALVETRLTPRQRLIVQLYFYEGRTQEEVASCLRISQQAVSRQLFGVVRNGKKVGGAVRRLQAVCGELGLKWV